MSDIDAAIQLDVSKAITSAFQNRSVSECISLFDNLEKALLEMPQIDAEGFQLKEWQSGGMYCRQITIPEGCLLTGRIYKRDHIEIMISGDISIVSAEGVSKRYKGQNTIEAKAGKRQAGYAHKETVWMTINLCPDKAEPDERLDYTSVLTYKELNNYDYSKFLEEESLTEEEITGIVNTEDIIDMPKEFNHIYKDYSDIDGEGLFSKKSIARGDIICPVRIGNNRTIAGRYTNHSATGNAKPCFIDGEFVYIACCDISSNSEITSNYRLALEVRRAEGDL
jgi:hypothetical protein